MARPFKTGLDYFPLDIQLDEKIKLVEAENKITGFGVWVKLMQRVYANSYWLLWDKKTIIVFSNEINVDINSINDVINSCLEWGVFSKKIFEKFSVLTSHGIQKRYFEITKRRKYIEIIKPFLLFKPKPESYQQFINVDINSINVNRSTQSKVKESKVKEKTDIPQNEFADEIYLTKKKRKLTGKRLETFERFWIEFNYKKGKADAADTWLDIPELTNKLVDQICEAAENEASRRPKLISEGKTPIYAQGWLSGRRWEDEETAQNQKTEIEEIENFDE